MTPHRLRALSYSQKKCWRLARSWAISLPRPMSEKITRRKALKIGTAAAVGAAIAPHSSSSAEPNFTEPDGASMPVPAQCLPSASPESEICFMSAPQMADLTRLKEISALGWRQADLKQVKHLNAKAN